MNEIECAITDIEEFLEADIGQGDLHMCSVEIALAALREKQERDKGCEVCNSLVAMRYETVCDWSDDGKAVWDTNTMHFCPNCGAKMESEGGT